MSDVQAALVEDLLRSSRDRVEPVLWSAIQTLANPIREVCEYHFGWRDLDGVTRDKPIALGKGIRSALVFLGAQSVGDGRQGIDDAATAASGIELIHNFSLIHDDIMDEDKTRRHRETVWSAFGQPAGILAGDALLSLGLNAGPVQWRAGGELARAVQELIHGQFLDLDFEARQHVDLQTCSRMADLKTAALTAAACALGGHSAGADESEIESLRSYGRNFGLAFQLADDVLGIIGSSGSTGKAEKNDIWRRKRSLPIVYALTQKASGAQRLRDLYEQDQWGIDDVDEAFGLVIELGAVEWAREESAGHVRVALDSLDRSPRISSSQAFSQFEALAVFASDRKL